MKNLIDALAKEVRNLEKCVYEKSYYLNHALSIKSIIDEIINDSMMRETFIPNEGFNTLDLVDFRFATIKGEKYAYIDTGKKLCWYWYCASEDTWLGVKDPLPSVVEEK